MIIREAPISEVKQQIQDLTRVLEKVSGQKTGQKSQKSKSWTISSARRWRKKRSRQPFTHNSKQNLVVTTPPSPSHAHPEQSSPKFPTVIGGLATSWFYIPSQPYWLRIFSRLGPEICISNQHPQGILMYIKVLGQKYHHNSWLSRESKSGKQIPFLGGV